MPVLTAQGSTAKFTVCLKTMTAKQILLGWERRSLKQKILCCKLPKSKKFDQFIATLFLYSKFIPMNSMLYMHFCNIKVTLIQFIANQQQNIFSISCVFNNNKMKKVSNLTVEKIVDNKIARKYQPQIKFNLSPCNLACFKGKQKTGKSKCKMENFRDSKNNTNLKPQIKNIQPPKTIQLIQRERGKTFSFKNNFNEQVVFMQYDNIDVYIDKSQRKKSKQSNQERSENSSPKKRDQCGQEIDEQIVQSCVRVITEQTDNTLNNFSFQTPPNLTPRPIVYRLEQFYKPQVSSRNVRSITIQDGKIFIIDYQNIINDGRTTIMIKNIPNKYNQQTLLQEFSVKFQNKFDFFYLPIDKNNDCNVGYAFLNFTNIEDLQQFYIQFHNKKWKKYKSPKICNISYARYQGTLELANHFRHSKILHQKDRKLKPLIGIAEANRKRDIEEMIRIQKQREQ